MKRVLLTAAALAALISPPAYAWEFFGLNDGVHQTGEYKFHTDAWGNQGRDMAQDYCRTHGYAFADGVYASDSPMGIGTDFYCLHKGEHLVQRPLPRSSGPTMCYAADDLGDIECD
jgi:hypothetical protein